MDELKTFPSNAAEALTMLYLQNQDLSNVSPENLAAMYGEAKSRIKKALAKNPSTQQTFTF